MRDGYDYVKSEYKVAVEAGQRVTLCSPGCDPRRGTVKPGRGDQYVRVHFDGFKFTSRVHPHELLYDTPSSDASPARQAERKLRDAVDARSKQVF